MIRIQISVSVHRRSKDSSEHNFKDPQRYILERLLGDERYVGKDDSVLQPLSDSVPVLGNYVSMPRGVFLSICFVSAEIQNIDSTNIEFQDQRQLQNFGMRRCAD